MVYVLVVIVTVEAATDPLELLAVAEVEASTAIINSNSVIKREKKSVVIAAADAAVVAFKHLFSWRTMHHL